VFLISPLSLKNTHNLGKFRDKTGFLFVFESSRLAVEVDSEKRSLYGSKLVVSFKPSVVVVHPMSIVRDGKGNPQTCVTHGHGHFEVRLVHMKHLNDDDSPWRGTKRKRAHYTAEGDHYHDLGPEVSMNLNLRLIA
jgi:hypothetical protein